MLKVRKKYMKKWREESMKKKRVIKFKVGDIVRDKKTRSEWKVIFVRNKGIIVEEILPSRFTGVRHLPMKARMSGKSNDFYLVRKAEDIPDPYSWLKQK